jgi:acetate kinase
MAADGLAFLGIALDADRNAASGGDREISTAGTRVSVLVVTAREDLQIAREVRQVLDR